MADRAQTLTMEAVVAALLLFAAVAFAIHAVAISANTASVGDTELRNQHAGVAQGVLDAAVANDSITPTLLAWDENTTTFHGSGPDEVFHVGAPPNTTFGAMLDDMLGSHHRRYNVDLSYRTQAGEVRTQRLVELGTPTADAVRVSRTVTLHDDSRLVDVNGTPRDNVTLADVSDDFYAPNLAENRSVYTVIRVEVIVWS